MKGGREHRVPLSGRALAILNEARGARRWKRTWCFRHRPGASPCPIRRFPGYCVSSVSTPCRTASVRPSGTGARSPRACHAEVAEACLAHAVRGVEGAYARSDLLDLRRKLMDRWANVSGERCRRHGRSDDKTIEGGTPMSPSNARSEIESEYEEAKKTACVVPTSGGSAGAQLKEPRSAKSLDNTPKENP